MNHDLHIGLYIGHYARKTDVWTKWRMLPDLYTTIKYSCSAIIKVLPKPVALPQLSVESNKHVRTGECHHKMSAISNGPTTAYQ